ncbi:uncharacterized protein LOC105161990 [Sesamum indicum]|uniref:Uncharacterized protein LOC105161990 n=1 Tax=Sesamum indicum TaxID=4182 RepID=A0A6I9T5A1_SESIN|nr:uncharacterized protein LOC105161990 [Sesamum indicum]
MVEGDEKKGFCGFDEGGTVDCAQDARLLLSVRSSGRGHNIEKYKKQKFRRYAHSGHGNDHIMLACWLVVVGEEPPANESAALENQVQLLQIRDPLPTKASLQWISDDAILWLKK